MTNKAKTGSVTAKTGRVMARNIITGIDIEGEASDEVINAALETMKHLNTGNVSGAGGVEAREDIVVGFRHINPQAPDRESFVAELKALRETLAELQQQPETTAEAEAATQSLDDAISEAQKEEPQGKLIVKRLRDTVEFITDASKALEAASKAGPLIAKAIPTGVTLYKLAQTLF